LDTIILEKELSQKLIIFKEKIKDKELVKIATDNEIFGDFLNNLRDFRKYVTSKSILFDEIDK
jgi:hypothetical protein